MNFPEYKNSNNQTLHIPNFSAGLCFRENTHSEKTSGLKDCKNLWFKKGVLQSRPGLFTKESYALTSGIYSGGSYEAWETTPLEAEIEGDIKKIILETIDYDISAYFLITHFISSDGSTYCSPTIQFSRVDSDTFYIPRKINFYKGAPQTGSGIFAMISVINSENSTMTNVRFYELNGEYTNWNRVYSPYIPTALINGRGNKYEIAKGTNQAYTGTPTELEELNILNGTFHCYFSTDGYSSSFRLPYSNLANERVVCRIFHSVNEYSQWIIEKNSNEATITFWGVDVTMHVSREKGIVYFTVEAGEYEVPMFYDRNQNNLRITATKEIPYTLFDIAEADVCFSEGDTILFANKNTVFEANYKNPLYFPMGNAFSVGSEDFPITAFKKIGNSIALFKKTETYLLSVKQGQPINTLSLLADSDAVFYSADSCDTKCVSSTVGTVNTRLIARHLRKLYFLACDQRVYTLEASGRISPLREDFSLSVFLTDSGYSKIFSATIRNAVIFFGQNRAVIFQIDGNSNVSCYFWEFPEDISFSGVYSLHNKLWLICRNTKTQLNFMATLSGDRDMVNFSDSKEIEVHLRTEKISLGCDNSIKKINKILLNFKGSGDIYVNDRLHAGITNPPTDDFNITQLIPGICAVNLMDISLVGTAPLALGSVDISFTTLKA